MKEQIFANVPKPELLEPGVDIAITDSYGKIRGRYKVVSTSNTEINLRELSRWDVFKFSLRHPILYAKYFLKIK